jgi:hypothetical protein
MEGIDYEDSFTLSKDQSKTSTELMTIQLLNIIVQNISSLTNERTIVRLIQIYSKKDKRFATTFVITEWILVMATMISLLLAVTIPDIIVIITFSIFGCCCFSLSVTFLAYFLRTNNQNDLIRLFLANELKVMREGVEEISIKVET